MTIIATLCTHARARPLSAFSTVLHRLPSFLAIFHPASFSLLSHRVRGVRPSPYPPLPRTSFHGHANCRIDRRARRGVGHAAAWRGGGSRGCHGPQSHGRVGGPRGEEISGSNHGSSRKETNEVEKGGREDGAGPRKEKGRERREEGSQLFPPCTSSLSLMALLNFSSKLTIFLTLGAQWQWHTPQSGAHPKRATVL